jgi:MinD-like ATPase involved in chromosome partitioning or flagellar assembly
MAKIVSIHSYRGGTGKSNLTANLATCVANEGRRVGIVDTDIQSPGIHVLFGLHEQKTSRALNDFLWGRCAIEETAYHVTLPRLAGSICLIPSSINTGEITRILREGYDVGLLNDGFQALVAHFRLDYLFIDTHPGLNEETLLSIAVSNLLVLILRPDQQDFLGTAVTLDVARKLGVPKLLLVVNKALPTLDFAALKQHVEETYNAPVADVFPQCTEMMQLASGGIFCLQYPEHPLSAQLRKLAREIMSL